MRFVAQFAYLGNYYLTQLFKSGWYSNIQFARMIKISLKYGWINQSIFSK